MPLAYGIDIHGTLAVRKPDGTLGRSTLFPLLESLMRAWVAQGEVVFILSGPPTAQIEEELDDLGLTKGVHYRRALSMVDNVKNLFPDAPFWEHPDKPNHFWTDAPTWNAIKGKMARQWAIDIVIDDQAEYVAAMPATTSFVLVHASLLGSMGLRR